MRVGRVAGMATLVVAGLMIAGPLPAGLSAGPTAAATPALTNWYRLPATHGATGRTRSTWSASNWSGYAETGHFTSISGSWTVPRVRPGVADTRSEWFSATWVGIDGFNDTDLIQTGTEQDDSGGSASYSAWWEILPKAETTIPDPVSPGDTMEAAITQTAVTVVKRKRIKVITDEWNIRLQDVTAGWSFSTTQVYKGPGDSAELIVEAPFVGRSLSTLADYSFPAGSSRAGDFRDAAVSTTVGGAPTGAGLDYQTDAGTLIQGGLQVSTPGAPDASATAFNSSYGATEPAAPPS